MKNILKTTPLLFTLMLIFVSCEETKKETKDVDICKCLTLPGNSVYMQENNDACRDAISKEIGVKNWEKVNMSLPNNAKISAKFDKLAKKCM